MTRKLEYTCFLANTHQPGDLPPRGYTAWHEWAKVQHRAGLRQARCPTCGLWRFPQEKCHSSRADSGKRRGVRNSDRQQGNYTGTKP